MTNPSSAPSASRDDRRARRLLAAVALAGLLLALAIALDHRAERAERLALALRADAFGLAGAGPDGALTGELLRAADADEARLAVARRLVAGGLVPRPSELAEATAQSLDEAARLAGEVLARRPTSWEAANLLGAATYLARSWRRDTRLYTRHREWEEPLLLARRLAPGRPEPARFLAAAYLELWPALSPDKRRAAGEVIAVAFEERAVFEQLAGAWLATAREGSEAEIDRLFAAVPARSEAWRRLASHFAATGDWSTFCRAWEQEREALHGELRERITTGQEHLAAGDLLTARSRLLGVLTAAAPASRFAPLVVEALEAAPHAPATPERAEAFARWLLWGLDRCSLSAGEDCPFPQSTFARLAGQSLQALPPGEARLALAARTALAAGDLRGADRAERESRVHRHPIWDRYWIDRARHALDRGATTEARMLLGRVAAERDSLPFLLVQAKLGRPDARPATAGAAQTELAAAARDAWGASSWSRLEGRPRPHHRLDFLPRRETDALALDLGRVPLEGTAVELRLDGVSLGCFPLVPAPTSPADASERTELELVVQAPEGPLDAVPHRLEVETVGRGLVEPLGVSLQDLEDRR